MDYRQYKNLLEYMPVVKLLTSETNRLVAFRDSYYSVFTDLTDKEYDNNLVLRTILEKHIQDEIVYQIQQIELPF